MYLDQDYDGHMQGWGGRKVVVVAHWALWIQYLILSVCTQLIAPAPFLPPASLLSLLNALSH
jgi:hypothetical protein